MQFIDSFQFTLKSLDKLVSTMAEDDFILTRKEYGIEREFKLMTKKGIFPYDFFDSVEKLQYTSFPNVEKFYNMLEDKECSLKVSDIIISMSFTIYFSFLLICSG